ncbi:MAG: single-stranded-DNA-specific exonuclease [Parcubacteria group bacterium LiPW_39]|nr:MAG: single-stranded-DNA-specific exonuclease [Parcubacteria group bacterium LiPW_39]
MIWSLKPKVPEEFIKQFPEYSPEILQLLFNRGLKTQPQIDEFFNPDYEGDLHDPFLMLGASKAVKRIQRAIKKQEKIAIFGDYDCDGICGAVILKTTLEELGANLSGGVYIPDRIIEGYGLNLAAVKKLGEQKVELILTVDCGISDIAEIELANKLGIDVVVIDHHRLGKELPPAKAIIDPWQEKDKYPFKDLAGAGVAFKLVQALIKKLKVKSEKVGEGWEKWLLDLVALATVADLVPLVGENRTLVKYGLIVLAQTKRVGLQELMKISRLNPVFEVESLKTNLDTYSLGFILAPRLNAAGRMDHASLALELLVAKERVRAQELAQKINEHNQQRQKLTSEIIEQIEEQNRNILDDKNQSVIVIKDKNWSPGVIGLVAGKIAERYHRPTIIFKEDQVESRGSARSIPSFNIIEAISQCAEVLGEFGGHPGAAGLSLANKNYEIFREKINQIARAKLKDEDLIPVLEIDLELEPEKITWELLDEIVRFEPCGGERNPYPVFLTKELAVASLRTVGNGSKHLKLELKSDKMPGKIWRAIGFGLANGHTALKIGDKIDAVFELMADEWNGTRNLQVKIIDIKNTNTARINHE